MIAGSPAAAAGFQPHDVITRIGNQRIDDQNDAHMIIATHSGDTLAITVQRDGRPVVLTATPRRTLQVDRIGGASHMGMLGIGFRPDPGDIRFQGYDPLVALRYGVHECWSIVATTVTYIGRIFTGKESGDQLGGPIQTVGLAGGVTQSAIEGGGGSKVDTIRDVAESLLTLVAMVSVAVGFLNLLPIPVLDGGHLLFYGYEAVARKPLRARVQEVGLPGRPCFAVGTSVVRNLERPAKISRPEIPRRARILMSAARRW